jgi:hypothetical protein
MCKPGDREDPLIRFIDYRRASRESAFYLMVRESYEEFLETEASEVLSAASRLDGQR